MPATSITYSRLRFALAPAVFVAAALSLAVHAQPPDTGKKGADTKTAPKDKDAPFVKLPDGTYLWLGTPTDGSGERVSLTPAELQKLLDQLDQLKKQLAARKAVAPSGCAIRGKVEKRGEQLVAVLKLTCTCHTTAPQTVVSLGGRRGFLVTAALDANKLPVLDTSEDGFAVLIENAGDHTLTLELEAPITARGAKPELGFEIGLPRAPITTLLFDPPSADVKRVNLTTRTPDPAKTGPAEPRRWPALDIKQLAPKPGQDGYALGPLDSLEVTWDPPTTATQPADQVQSAEVTVNVLLTEGVVESTAKIALRGPAREWKIVAPASADVSVERAPGVNAEVGPTLSPVVTKPVDASKPVWKIELPAGSSAADWVVTAVTRQQRPKPEDPKHRGPFPIGPFTTLDVFRQIGTVKVTAGAHTHFAFKHGPDLRKAEPTGPAEDEVTAAFFRLTTGPTGTTPVNAPAMFTVEAWPQPKAVVVKPTYRLTLTDAGWRVRAEVKVLPIRNEVDSVAVDVPTDWWGFEASSPELVEGVQQGTINEGFWSATGLRLAGGLRVPVVIKLAAGHKQPFDLVLTATVPFEPGEFAATVPFPRFPGATETTAIVTATVPDGLEVHGESRNWESEFAAWGSPLTPAPGADGKPSRVVTAVTARAETGFARVILGWNLHRPDLNADIRATAILGERQLVVEQQMKLRSAEGFTHPIRFYAPPGASVTSKPPLTSLGKDEWLLNVAPDGKDRELSLAVTIAVNLPARPTEENAPWAVPVGLLWPIGATRADTTVRVWSNAAAGRSITLASNGWRELPVEAVPERETLPALTLSTSGSEIPLTLDVREVSDPGAVAVWVERGLIQAWAASEGVTEYRARFLLRRSLTPSVGMYLPGPLAGPNAEFRRDGLKIDAIPLPDTGGTGRTFRIPLPESVSGKATVIEVRYQLPSPQNGAGESVYQPPLIPTGAFVGPVRWQVTVAQGSTPFLTAGAIAEFRWRLRSTGLAPSPTATGESLEKWFRTGEEPVSGDDPATNGETLQARQASLAPITVYRAPQTGLVIVCAIVVFVLILVVSRLPGWSIGPAVAVIGGLIGVGAVFLPHPAAQIAGACQPGIVGAIVVLLALAAARVYHRRRITRLPGFTRTSTEPSVALLPLTSSNRKQPSAIGSAGSAGPAPTASAGG
jgi:hypothetical protein